MAVFLFVVTSNTQLTIIELQERYLCQETMEHFYSTHCVNGNMLQFLHVVNDSDNTCRELSCIKRNNITLKERYY